ncbi:tetraacyldisaccharide 4'-kinase [Hyphococcus sp. DH-69]|uniref:tetraacyldisaccharide 4'-kinase n=1 Tax=Hyphococcus formosus TaxID=3143534 RepID=UPI00398A600A
MMKEPWFWHGDTIAAKAVRTTLKPLAYLYSAGHHFRCAMTKTQRASIPIICIGNATVGGVGKTPLAIRIYDLLREDGIEVFFLSRGYGGSAHGPLLVDRDQHTADEVGDEALLLAAKGPTIVSRNRPTGAAFAAKHGAQAIIMDDGFQNPTIYKDVSILLVNNEITNSQEHLFPAGPFRESLNDARQRADIVVGVGDNIDDAKLAHPADHYAWREAVGAIEPMKVIAFAGIGRPQGFFDLLAKNGFTVEKAIGFPDHHQYAPTELDILRRKAVSLDAQLMTTEKDFVRLPPEYRQDVATLKITMALDDPDGLRQRIMSIIHSTADNRPST